MSGTSAVPVALLRVLRRQMPFGRLTVPGRIDGATLQRAVHLAELVEDRAPDRPPPAPAPAASSGCMSSLTSGRGSSPSVELIVRSLAGEISASG